MANHVGQQNLEVGGGGGGGGGGRGHFLGELSLQSFLNRLYAMFTWPQRLNSD